MTRFLEWNYNHNTVIEWERFGECNHCGQCCADAGHIEFRFSGISSKLPDQDYDSRDGSEYVDSQGVWNETMTADGPRYFGRVRRNPDNGQAPTCPEWIDNRCACHKEKPLLCKAWPMSPSQVAIYDECSYTFMKVDEWPIDDSPETIMDKAIDDHIPDILDHIREMDNATP